jgi:hypothetical protein
VIFRLTQPNPSIKNFGFRLALDYYNLKWLEKKNIDGKIAACRAAVFDILLSLAQRIDSRKRKIPISESEFACLFYPISRSIFFFFCDAHIIN